MTLEKLQVIIEAYTKPYREEMEKVKQQTTAATNHVERQTSKIRNSFKKIAGIVAVVFSVTALVAFGKSCIKLGSDLQEVQNVVDVTFGSMSAAVNQFSKNAITQFGLSELTAKKYMGTYGAMAKSFGIVGEAGYQMSAAITGLTGDVASFYNLSTDEAYTKLKSVFTGETESLKELGVVMTQSALDQYALANGFGRTTAKMSEQEKVMLRYQFVMSSLADAQGDFTRTSDSWANQVRVLQLQFESLKATIGQGLINAFTPVIRVINTILAKLQTLANYFKAFTAALFGDASGSDAVSGAADSMASAAGSSGAVADNMGSAAQSAKDLKKSLASFDELNNLSADSSGSGGGSGGGGVPDFGDMSGELFGDVTVNPEIEAATARIKDAVEKLKVAAKPTTDALKRLWDEGLSLLGNFTWTALKDFWDYFLVPLGKWVLGEGLPRFIDITNELLKSIDWERLNTALRDFWKALEPFVEHVGEGLLWFYEHVLAPLAVYVVNDAVTKFLEELTEVLEGLNIYIEKVKPAFEWLGDKLDWFREFMNGHPAIKEWVSDGAIDNLLDSVEGFRVLRTFTDALNTLEGLETWFNEKILPYLDEVIWNDIGKNIISGIVNGFAYGVSHFIPDSLKDFYWFFVNKLKERFGIASPAKEMKPYGENILLGIIVGFRNTFDEWTKSLNEWYEKHIAPWFTAKKWSELYNTIKSELKKAWDNAVSQWQRDFDSWWNDIKTKFSSFTWENALSGVKTGFKNAFDAAFTGVKQAWNQFAKWLNEKLNFTIGKVKNPLTGEVIFDGMEVNLGKIPTFATGGFPAQGQMFMARESGPELVGRIGSRTAVANNDQIVDAVSKGVYMAVSSAGGMDEETLYRAFKRAFAEVDLKAVLDSEKNFKDTQKKAQDYKNRTGNPAFAW